MAPQHVHGLSVRVQCWSEPEAGTTRVRVERIDRQEEIQLNDGTFLVRVVSEGGHLMQRCFIRHLASGREAYVQGGPGLGAFIKDSLLAEPSGGETPPPERAEV